MRSSVTANAIAFAFGQVFRKGDLPSGQRLALNTATSQFSPISTWDDGSVKHAHIAGTVDLVSGTAATVSIGKTTAGVGAALSEVQLIAANPQASITYGSYGTVNLASLLGTSAKVTIEHAGPQYAAFQYLANFPNDATLSAVFYVQLWANGHYRVRVACENGRALNASATKSGTAVVVIAGATVLNTSVSMPQGVRWDAVGSNGPEATVTHNAAYLRATKLVPNYGYTSPSASTLSNLKTAYTPMNRLDWEQDMGSPGFTPGIGLLPNWDALYATTGAENALACSIAHSRAMGAYSIFYRSSSTRTFPLFSNYPTAVNGGDQEGMNGAGTNSNRWEVAHHPHAGYLPWLVTGERFHLETILANAWTAWYTDSGGGRTGTGKLFTSQTRARAWRYRTIASAAAVLPDVEPLKAECKASVVANLGNWNSQHVAPNSPATGLGATYDDQDAAAGMQRSLFEHFFLVASIGWSWDQEMQLSASERSLHAQVRDYFYRVPVGVTGRGPANGEYSWRRGPGPYRTTVGPDSGSFYSSWGAVYQATYGDNLDSQSGLTIMESYADDPSPVAFPQGNWGHLLTALSYAVDHGATGAAEGYARVKSASNFTSNTVKFNDSPEYGVVPRT